MDDSISRQAAIDALNGEITITGRENAKAIQAYINGVGKKLRELPSAERRGRWIMHIDDLFPEESTMECNQCHEEQPLECDDKYCPNCGASMMHDDLFPCDPDKADGCYKTFCYRNGGECRMTTREEWRRKRGQL